MISMVICIVCQVVQWFILTGTFGIFENLDYAELLEAGTWALY